MLTTLMPLPKQQFLNALGVPLIGGKVYTYAAGTNNLKDTFADAAGAVKQPNPIPLNLRGEPDAPIFWNGAYKVVLCDSLGNVIYSVDNYSTDPAGLWQLGASDGTSRIGFIQSGESAIAQVLQDRARRMMVDLEDFGGSGDWNGGNGSDNTNAIIKAIKRLGSKGGIIRVHPGGYGYDPTAIGQINAPIIFMGDGRFSSSLVKVGNGVGLSFGAGASYGGIADLMLDSAAGHGDVSDGMYVAAGRILTRGAGIQNQGGKGLNLYAANCSTFSDLMILQCADDLIYINGNAAAPDVNGMTFIGLDLRVSTNGAAFRNVNGISNFVYGISCQGSVNGGGIVMGGSYNRVVGAYSENNGGAGKGALQFTAGANYNIVDFGIASDFQTPANATGSNSWNLPNDTRSNNRQGALTVLQDALINNASVGNGPGSSTSNTRLGTNALVARTSGTNNTGVGNTAAGAVTTGSNNTATGYNALLQNTTGSWNTAIGTNALRDMVTGDVCTAIGYQAGRFLQGGASMTGISGAICIGANSAVSAANQAQIGESTVTTYVYGTVQNRSDARDKADVRETGLGLDFINALRPVDYRYDYREDYYEEYQVQVGEEPYQEFLGEDAEGQAVHEPRTRPIYETRRRLVPKDGSKKRARFHHGLIAQEVKAVCEKLGVDFGGFQDHAISGGADVLSIGYDELFGPLIKATQQLSSKVDSLTARLDAAGL